MYHLRGVRRLWNGTLERAIITLRRSGEEVHRSQRVTMHTLWETGTPERVLQDAGLAFLNRDGRRLAQLATRESLQAFVRWQLKDRPDSRDDAADQLQEHAGRLVEESLGRPPQPKVLQYASFVPLGHVTESAETAHVLLSSAETAHVVFYVRLEMPDGSVIALPPEPQIATAHWEEGAWRLVLDFAAPGGMPGFRNVYFWETDESDAGSAAEPSSS